MDYALELLARIFRIEAELFALKARIEKEKLKHPFACSHSARRFIIGQRQREELSYNLHRKNH